MAKVLQIHDRLKYYIQALDNDQLAESLWWVQRWVTGSMDDDEWDESWLTAIKSLDDAFVYIQKHVGHKAIKTGTVLYRMLHLNRLQVENLQKTKLIYPHTYNFQSFTTAIKIANKLKDDLANNYRSNQQKLSVIVSVKPRSEDIMFSIKDLLKASKTNAVVDEWINSLDHWYYQNEVIVRVSRPLPVLQVLE